MCPCYFFAGGITPTHHRNVHNSTMIFVYISGSCSYQLRGVQSRFIFYYYEKNNEDGSFYGGTDLYDCSDYSNVLDGLPKGQWMIDWARALQKKNKEPKKPSSFAQWSKQHK